MVLYHVAAHGHKRGLASCFEALLQCTCPACRRHSSQRPLHYTEDVKAGLRNEFISAAANARRMFPSMMRAQPQLCLREFVHHVVQIVCHHGVPMGASGPSSQLGYAFSVFHRKVLASLPRFVLDYDVACMQAKHLRAVLAYVCVVAMPTLFPAFVDEAQVGIECGNVYGTLVVGDSAALLTPRNMEIVVLVTFLRVLVHPVWLLLG